MFWERRGVLCLVFVLGFDQLLGFPSGKSGPGHEAELTVRLYNYAKVSDETLSAARRHAKFIFHGAGIALILADCPVSEDDAKRTACPQRTSSPDLVLRVISGSTIKQSNRPAGELGFAADLEATIFFNRVQEFCRDHSAPEWTVLGQVMAHEIGHLLLGEKSHSEAGIMRAFLRPESLTGRRGSYFTNFQAKEMRARIRNSTPVLDPTSPITSAVVSR